MKTNIRLVYGTVLLAAVLWFIQFVIHPFNFWYEMAFSILLLCISAVLVNRDKFDFGTLNIRDVVVGIISAGVLYLIFYLGNIMSGVIFPFKDQQILSVYQNAEGTSPFLIAAFLVLVIGPGEEIFWRGFIQKVVSIKYGEQKGIILSVLLYTAVHLLTGNFMLILAALVCGTFWGLLYWKEKRLLPVIISHAIWDVTAFVLLPFQS